MAPSLADLLTLDDGAFRKLFSGSPVKRIGRDRFVRNVLIAAGNSGERALVPRIEARLGDPAAVVRGAAVWALRRLATAGEIERAKGRFLAAETEPEVRDEWTG
jgi:epoxyqueuosine reductase